MLQEFANSVRGRYTETLILAYLLIRIIYFDKIESYQKLKKENIECYKWVVLNLIVYAYSIARSNYAYFNYDTIELKRQFLEENKCLACYFLIFGVVFASKMHSDEMKKFFREE